MRRTWVGLALLLAGCGSDPTTRELKPGEECLVIGDYGIASGRHVKVESRVQSGDHPHPTLWSCYYADGENAGKPVEVPRANLRPL